MSYIASRAAVMGGDEADCVGGAVRRDGGVRGHGFCGRPPPTDLNFQGVIIDNFRERRGKQNDL